MRDSRSHTTKQVSHLSRDILILSRDKKNCGMSSMGHRAYKRYLLVLRYSRRFIAPILILVFFFYCSRCSMIIVNVHRLRTWRTIAHVLLVIQNRISKEVKSNSLKVQILLLKPPLRKVKLLQVLYRLQLCKTKHFTNGRVY